LFIALPFSLWRWTAGKGPGKKIIKSYPLDCSTGLSCVF
jgi:hypothetical protein